MRRSALAASLLLISAGGVAAYRAGALPVEVTDIVEQVTDMTTSIDTADRNLRAFLLTIRHAEGTAGLSGYRMLFGGRLFESFADHPRVLVELSGYRTTAAGAYQILSRTWDGIRAGLPDFSPASQDIAAARLIRRRGALADVYAGRFAEAIRKCAGEWASLPGSPYGQPTKTMQQVAAAYAAAGGVMA